MAARVTGHVLLKERQRGSVYYVKYRLADGRQVQKLLGPAWTERSRPAAGYYTKRTAEEALQAILVGAREGTLPDSQKRSGKTFGDACAVARFLLLKMGGIEKHQPGQISRRRRRDGPRRDRDASRSRRRARDREARGWNYFSRRRCR